MIPTLQFAIDDTLGAWRRAYPNAADLLVRAGFARIPDDSTFDAACLKQGIEALTLIEQLVVQLKPSPHITDEDWSGLTINELLDDVERFHHAFTRNELLRIGMLFDRLRAGSQGNDYEADHHRFLMLRQFMYAHLRHEEEELFPACRLMDDRREDTNTPPPPLEEPLREMAHGHDQIGEDLAALRTSLSRRLEDHDRDDVLEAVLVGLDQLRIDIEMHTFKEYDILFPAVAFHEEAERSRTSVRRKSEPSGA